MTKFRIKAYTEAEGFPPVVFNARDWQHAYEMLAKSLVGAKALDQGLKPIVRCEIDLLP